jgi:hypothetical protein
LTKIKAALRIGKGTQLVKPSGVFPLPDAVAAVIL